MASDSNFPFNYNLDFSPRSSPILNETQGPPLFTPPRPLSSRTCALTLSVIVKDCATHADCSTLRGTSCVRDYPSHALKCLCGNNKPPINEYCPPTTSKGKVWTREDLQWELMGLWVEKWSLRSAWGEQVFGLVSGWRDFFARHCRQLRLTSWLPWFTTP